MINFILWSSLKNRKVYFFQTIVVVKGEMAYRGDFTWINMNTSFVQKKY